MKTLPRPWFWIRFGHWRRLGVIPDDGHPPFFSERYGYVKVWRVLGYIIKWDRVPATLWTRAFMGGWK